MERNALQAVGRYRAQFEPTGPAWLQEIRRRGIEAFERAGFPTRAREEWRFTDLTALAETPFEPAGRFSAAVLADSVTSLSACHLVCVNGHYERRLSSPLHGIRIVSLAEFLEGDPAALRPHLGSLAAIDRHPLAALNTALFHDGAVVIVPRGKAPAEPIHLVFAKMPGSVPQVAHPRTLIVVEEGAQAAIVEEHIGLDDGPYWSNLVVEVIVGDGAKLDYYKVQRDRPAVYHTALTAARVGRDASWTHTSISLGAGLARNDIEVALSARGAECGLRGLYVTGGVQLVDHHTLIDHTTPDTYSRELYKGILNDRSRGVFHGRIIVRPGAQKTDAAQTNKNLLLSDTALVNSNPQLEIFANDVQCRHGSSIGQISADELYYLRSRGIGRDAARRILIQGFAREMLEGIAVAPLREALDCHLLLSLSGR